MLHENSGYTFLLLRMRLQAVVILLALVAWFGPMGSAHAGTTVRVVETWPSGDDVALGRNQSFYLRLAYDTDKPVGIWVAPYFHGKRVSVGRQSVADLFGQRRDVRLVLLHAARR